ncbi:hypothetical protein JZO70_07980 [Enterococcus sp. 669A]|uniref:DUF5067 domain-containing protein n=1 Tax=Candidatus Enterococcus moelleringii TaxID=2815325 RepID=A0ABS3L900_9ENTE|nr:hypothetical protein [Enterococcus sp. 669A]MBO1306096.1 hypothetical protein [Enterococcus sp. 669A]
MKKSVLVAILFSLIVAGALLSINLYFSYPKDFRTFASNKVEIPLDFNDRNQYHAANIQIENGDLLNLTPRKIPLLKDQKITVYSKMDPAAAGGLYLSMINQSKLFNKTEIPVYEGRFGVEIEQEIIVPEDGNYLFYFFGGNAHTVVLDEFVITQ